MKVLFAVNDEKDAEAIARKYQNEYKEIISSKTVYYFNAIIKELQKDKTYDRIVISEDLEMFASDNYQAVDKFIFEKMDTISDEATNEDGNDIPIIFLCMDRRTKNDSLLIKLFGLGIYNALIGQDRNVQKVASLMYKPRSKKEAKAYYRVEAENVTYSADTKSGEVSESEIQNILTHYKKIGNNIPKCVKSFDSIAAQYSNDQLKVIIGALPNSVKVILEENSDSYRKIMDIKGKKVAGASSLRKNEYVEKEIDLGSKLTQPVIIPTAVSSKKVNKVVSQEELKRKKEEALKREKEKMAKERAEAKKREEERIAREKAEEEARKKEEERIAKEKAAAEAKRKEEERKAKQKAIEEARKREEERIAKKKAEAEAKRKEEERKAKEKAAAEAKRKEEERIAKEKAEAEAKRKEEERIAKEKAEAEAKRKEEERIAKEKAKAEAKRKEEERKAKEKAEAEAKRKEEERKAKEKAEAEAKRKEEEKNKAKISEEEIQVVKRGRGRPRKNPIETPVLEDIPVKKKRGRPRKTDILEPIENVVEEISKNKEIDVENEVSTAKRAKKAKKDENIKNNDIAIEDDILDLESDNEDIITEDILPGFEDFEDYKDDNNDNLLNSKDDEDIEDEDLSFDFDEELDGNNAENAEEDEIHDNDEDLELDDFDDEDFDDLEDYENEEDDDDFDFTLFDDDSDETDKSASKDEENDDESFDFEDELDDIDDEELDAEELDEEDLPEFEDYDEDENLEEENEDYDDLDDIDLEDYNDETDEEYSQEDEDIEDDEDFDDSDFDFLDEEEFKDENNDGIDDQYETELDENEAEDSDEESEDDEDFDFIDDEFEEENDEDIEENQIQESDDDLLYDSDIYDDDEDDFISEENDDEFDSFEEEDEEENQHNGSFKGINNRNYKYDDDLANSIKDLKETEESSEYNVETDNLITSGQKIISFVGTTKNGTSFIVNNLAELFSNRGIKTAILDLTKNKNSYYVYTNNEDELKEKAYKCLEQLQNGVADGVPVNNNLTVYTSLPGQDEALDNVTEIIKTLLENYTIVLLDCDFETDVRYFKASQEMYLVQSMDVLTIQPLTAFLRDLKVKDILDTNKLRIIINKNIKVNILNEKVLIGGMSAYNDPAMTYMTELFNKETIKYTTIPFEDQVYAKYLEGLANCQISLKGYSKNFIANLNKLGDMVYPTINGKKSKNYNDYINENKQFENTFSKNTSSILNKMKKKY